MAADFPVEIELSRPYTIHNRTYDKIRMRPPRWSDWVEVGEVESWIYRGDMSWHVTLPGNVEQYADRLCEDSAELLGLDLADAKRVEAQILDFFIEARRLNGSSAPSSSTSDGDPQTSPE